MDAKDKDTIISRYKGRFLEHGENIKALASGNEERRLCRFNVLKNIGIHEGCSVLDVGCGFSDFYAYLKSQFRSIKYTGIDIVPDFIGVSKKKYPEAEFLVCDIEEQFPDGRFDFIISSQCFNNKFQFSDNFETMRNILTICYSKAEKGVALDMLTDYVDFKESHLYYYSPERVLTYCKSLSKRVTLRHDYPLYEFCVYIYKDFKGWSV